METHEPKGKCLLCGVEAVKGAITRHLKLCAKAHAVEDDAMGKRKIKAFHVSVQGLDSPQYWLHLSVPAKASLENLDCFLRNIWLECCGHASGFRIGKTFYSRHPSSLCGDKSTEIGINKALAPGMKFMHDYDFGSTTRLVLKVVSEIENESDAIRLMARNNPPPMPCAKCGKPATKICAGCGGDYRGQVCDVCAPAHKCGVEMLLPVVNSPRAGVCGYCG